MQQFVTSSAFTRLCANLILLVVILGSILIIGIEILRGEQVNAFVLGVASSGISYAAAILGVHSGVVASGASPSDPPILQTRSVASWQPTPVEHISTLPDLPSVPKAQQFKRGAA